MKKSRRKPRVEQPLYPGRIFGHMYPQRIDPAFVIRTESLPRVCDMPAVKLCSPCGAVIDEERLDALPGTTLCAECAKLAKILPKVVPVAQSPASGRNGFASGDGD